MVAVIDYEKCIHCGSCVGACPTNAMKDGEGKDGKPKADPAVCTNSKSCVKICPVQAIHIEGGEAKAEEAPAEEPAKETEESSE